VTYKLQDFIADIGGLIGLFLGLSLLSMFEKFLKICSDVRTMIQRRFLKLRNQDREKSEDKSVDNRVQFLNDSEFLDDEPVLIQKKEHIFIIPERPSTPLIIEDFDL